MLYILILVFLCISSYVCDFANKRKWVGPLTFASAFVLFLLAGLSYEIGSDTVPYMMEYESASKLSSLQLSDFYVLNRQPGWILLESFFKTFFEDFFAFKFFQAFVVNFSVLFFLRRNSHHIATCLLLYYVSIYFPLNFEVMRESFAISIFLLSFDSLKDKKYIKYYISCVLALMFHISAVILLILPVLGLINIKKQYISKAFPVFLIFILISPAISFDSSIVNLIMSEKIAENADNYLGNASASLSLVYIVVFCFRYFIISRNISKIDVGNIILVLFLLSQFLGIFTRSLPILYRFGRYIGLVETICLSGALVSMLKNIKVYFSMKNTKVYISNIIRFLLMCLVLFILSYSSIKGYFLENPNTGEKQIEYYYPYKSVLSI